MKVFFKKQKKSKSGKILACAAVFLALTLIVSQWHIFSKKSTVSVSTEPEATSGIYDCVKLTSSQRISQGEVYIYLNGEEYAPFSGTEAQVNVFANGVVEVLVCGDKEFEISFEAPGINLEAIPGKGTVRCKKGINYLCRVVTQ